MAKFSESEWEKMMIVKCIKKFRHILIRLRIWAIEKEYEYDGRRIRYLYLPKKGATSLVVIFSAFPGRGKCAGYNLIDTLDGSNCNRLYVLDDFGYQKRGSYYLGEAGEFFLPPIISSLISKYTIECKKKIFIGSSKGGTAALFYGLSYGADVVIMGAPQYFLGNYLTEKEDHIPIMDAIMNGHEEEKIEELNHILPNLIRKCNSKEGTKIYIHYSPEEDTFLRHIKPLLEDLSCQGYEVYEDIEHYTSHNDVAKYFPDYCIKIIREIG